MKNTDERKDSFWNRVSSAHKRLTLKYKELDSVLTIVGVMVVGSTVITLCNKGSDTQAEVKVSLTDSKAEEYFFAGDYSKAINEYKKLESGQEWPYYEAKLAEVYSVSGDVKRSNELLDDVVKKRVTIIAENGRDMYESADGDLGTLVSYLAYVNENERAIEYAESFYKDNEDNFNLNVMMYTLYMAEDNKDAALEVLEKLSQSDERTAYELAIISKMYITADENDKGLEMLKEAWYKDKNDVKVYDVVSEITSSSVNNLTSKIEELAEDNDDEVCYKVWLLKHYSEDTRSSSKFTKLKGELNSYEIGSYMVELLKQGFYKDENNEYSKKVVQELINKGDATYSEENIIATYYENDKNFKKALEYTTRSVNDNRFYDKNYAENIPTELKEKGDNVRIEPYYRQAIYAEPYNCDSLLDLADYYKTKLSNNEKAYEFYSLASKIKPDDAEIIYKMAMAKLDNKEVDEAIKLIKKCTEIDSDNDTFHRTLGKIYYDEGKKDKVIGEIRKAYELDKEDIKTLNNAGCYYISSGENFSRGLYNLKCAYEMIKASDDIDEKRIITENYEAAKELKERMGDDNKVGTNPLIFEMFY